MEAVEVFNNRSRANLIMGSLISAATAGIASLAVTMNAYAETTHPIRISFLLILLIGLHLLLVPKLWVGREVKLYLAFLGYTLLSLLWTLDIQTALDQVTSSVNCGLVLILFSSLAAYHNRRAVFAGMLAGLLVAASAYTLTQRFPFVYPEGFSYNTMAGIYLFGLFSSFMFGWFTRRTVIPLAIGLLLLVLIAATTSIKTNLGIVLGAGTAGLFYARHFLKALRRTLLLFIVLGALVVVAINSNEAVTERITGGFDRIGLGVEVLLAREDASGKTEFGARESWKDYGLKGWLQNPVFGYGIEGFRADFGTTSHSTPIDLLYNSGVIGFTLFYAILLSILWRLCRASDSITSTLRPILFGFLICYVFISLSGILYNDPFLAVFAATSAVLLGEPASRRVSFRGENLDGIAPET